MRENSTYLTDGLPVNIKEFVAKIYDLDIVDPQDIKTHRQEWEKSLKDLNYKGPSVGQIKDIKTDKVHLRVYTPEGEGPFPLLIHYPGGAFVYSELSSHDPLCRHFCTDSKVVVVNVKTRVAPEHSPKDGLEDAYQALLWCIQNADKLNSSSNAIILSGDSSGGNFAALVAIRAANSGINNVKGQLLHVAATDLGRTGTSHKTYDKGYLLDRVDWFYNFYLSKSKSSAKDPSISPLYAKIPKDLAPAHIVFAKFDPLADDSIAYYEHLKKAGVSATLTELPVIHGMHLFEPIISTDGYPQTKVIEVLNKKLTDLKKKCQLTSKGNTTKSHKKLVSNKK